MKRVAAALVATTLLAGCGDDGAAAPTTTASPPSSTAAVTTTAPPSTVPPTTTPAPRPLPGGGLEVLVVGDSVMFDAAAAIEAAVDSIDGVDATPAAAFGLGLSDGAAIPLDPAELDGLDDSDQVVLMIGSWDHLAVQRDPGGYAATARAALSGLAAGGRLVLVLGEPPSAPEKGEDEARRALNAVLAEVAAGLPRVEYLDTDAVIGDAQGRFQERDGGMLLRKPDGRHLCPDGAARFGRAVLGVLGATWALPAPDSAWVDGPWRLDPRYDDPPGGCADG